MSESRQLITILGPTACGKTAVATQLACQLGGEIISADSRQVYRHMDIGTGKDLDDYVVNGIQIPYHLIDICEPGTKYNLFQYQTDFLKAYNDITERGRQPILCGGSGLYIESVIRGYQLSPVPQSQELRDSLKDKPLAELAEILETIKRQTGSNMHNTTDIDTPQRAIRAIEIELYNQNHPTERRTMPDIPSVLIGLYIGRDERRRNISARLCRRLDNGMIDEVKGLIDSGVKPEDLIYYGLEYKYVTEYVIGRISFQEMFDQLQIAIHQFAKRQMTWFRGMERRGCEIHWIDTSLPMQTKVDMIINLARKANRKTSEINHGSE